ncbi:MAG: hypothetical protein PF436_14005 [Prolixibacteraceae bacterium]|nr:hypothetical protein [Prolixibacteraceae bacterium]
MNQTFFEDQLPVDIVLAPEWWYHNERITFDEDFFYHPVRRVEAEQHMEKALYQRWGQYGLGKNHKNPRPEIGAVHLAAGFVLSEMLGCKVNYSESHPPQVIPLHAEKLIVDEEQSFKSPAFKKIVNLGEQLKKKYGYLSGDINWGGILNLAMDLTGESIFMDMMMDPVQVKHYFSQIASVIQKFTSYVEAETESTSISVNRVVGHFKQAVFLHSECSHTMISEQDYEEFLLPFDSEWSKSHRPFGIHYCGNDPHRMAGAFAKIPKLDFLDVGWGGDLAVLRQHLPDTFLNIRLSPVELIHHSNEQIRETIIKLVHESGNMALTGICCINIDEKVTEDKIETIFKTVAELKDEQQK